LVETASKEKVFSHQDERQGIRFSDESSTENCVLEHNSRRESSVPEGYKIQSNIRYSWKLLYCLNAQCYKLESRGFDSQVF
jgi:hypothetical protein